jgi:FkbM family methyltransferase
MHTTTHQSRLSEAWGLARSLAIYYGRPWRLRAMSHFYRQFIQPGDLCFDIGAHVGNRLWAWSRIGAQVVAVEPQPQCMRLLRTWYGHRPGVTLVEAAVGATPGHETLWISSRTPTVSTLSAPWIEAVRQDDSFAQVQWDRQIDVPMTTLDALIDRYGSPVFIKVDVEGFEPQVLQGLSRPVIALSFEYIPAARAGARACIERLAALGAYSFNYTSGEQHRWRSDHWLDAPALLHWLETLPATAGSGDIYACLQPPTPT